MPAGSFCLKHPVKDNYCRTITFRTGTFDPFDMNKHTTGTCIFISFDPFDMNKHTTGTCIFISFDPFGMSKQITGTCILNIYNEIFTLV